MTSPCTSGRWSAGRLLSRGHRLVRGWVSDFRSSSTAYAHHAGFRSPRPWRVWGHVVALGFRRSLPQRRKARWCVARLLSRAHRCAPLAVVSGGSRVPVLPTPPTAVISYISAIGSQCLLSIIFLDDELFDQFLARYGSSPSHPAFVALAWLLREGSVPASMIMPIVSGVV